MIRSKKVKKSGKSKKITAKKTYYGMASKRAKKNKKNWLAGKLAYYLKKIEAI